MNEHSRASMARTDITDEAAWAEAEGDPARYIEIMRRNGTVEPSEAQAPREKITNHKIPGRVFP